MKIGVIPLGSLDPVFLAKASAGMQTIDELYTEAILIHLDEIAAISARARSEKNDEARKQLFLRIASLSSDIEPMATSLNHESKDMRGHLSVDEYDVVIDNKRRVAIVLHSDYTSKGKVSFDGVDNSVDMQYPSNDGDECYVLGPEWFSPRRVFYDVHRRGKARSVNRRGKQK